MYNRYAKILALTVLCLTFFSCKGSGEWSLPGSAVNSAPVVVITSPADGSESAPGALITFAGTADDADEGELSGAALVWTSDVDGRIGTGNTFDTAALTDGTHTITLTATDASGEQGTAVITIIIRTPWFDARWRYRQQITISASMAPSDQADFPALIKITDNTNPLFANVLANGDDILFTADDGVSQLDHELELYDNAGTEELDAWVRIPNLSSTADTIIYMYYGNAGSANQENAAGVWSSNYVGVWHLSETAPSQHADSTANGYDSTSILAAQQGQRTTSIIGGSDEFDTMGQVVEIPDPGIDSPLDLVGSVPSTFSAWIYVRGPGPCTCLQSGILQKVGGYSFRLDGVNYSAPGDLTLVGTRIGNWIGISGTANGIPPNTWVYVAYTFEQLPGPADDIHSIYQDGTLDVSGTFWGGDAVSSDSVGIFRIGMWGGRTLDGFLDEVRISDTNRSADWIQAEYNNQNDPGSFLTFAIEESY